ncbi:MAG: Ig-like domain-containing protein [Gemmatimonadetes bacterium]|nr:Ig-like domain-containing protein [Gemmatimonadota bacterium]
MRDPQGQVITTTVTWVSETPAVASIDANGVVHALSVGTYRVRATAADGITTATYTLDTQLATAGGTAVYGNNIEFGVPADGDASDDILVARAQFTSSFNPARGIPNWVSYNLEATHIGTQDRCDCFTYDPALPSSLPRYTTADYTGAGTFAGYGSIAGTSRVRSIAPPGCSTTPAPSTSRTSFRRRPTTTRGRGRRWRTSSATRRASRTGRSTSSPALPGARGR